MTKSDQNLAASIADSLRIVAGVVLAAGLLLAPLNYGSTRLLPFETLIALALSGAAAWLTSCAMARAVPALPASVWIGAGLVGLSVLAWLLVLTPALPPDFTRQHVARLQGRWPHSIVPREPGLLVWWSVAGPGALMAWVALLRDEKWRRTTAVVITATGAVVALLGLVQNATGAPGIYWEATHRMPGAFFGAFFHHTSAGAYVNTVWPVALGLALSFIPEGGRTTLARRAMISGMLGCAALLLAAHSGHISRFPQVIAVAAMGVLVVWTRPWRLWRLLPRRARHLLALSAVATGLIVAIMDASRIGVIASRWSQLRLENLVGGRVAEPPPPLSTWPVLMRDDLFVPSDHRNYPLGDRGATYAAALGAIAERPWFGWGPGAWTAAAAAHSVDPFVRTFFLTVQFTHNDLLQTWVEWGLFGAAGWSLLIGGAVVFAFVRLRHAPAQDFIAVGAAVGLAAVLVQSLIDFPLQIPAVHFNALALAGLAWSAAPAPGASLPVFTAARS